VSEEKLRPIPEDSVANSDWSSMTKNNNISGLHSMKGVDVRDEQPLKPWEIKIIS